MLRVSSYLIGQVDSLGLWALATVEYTIKVLGMIYFSIRATICDQAQGIRSVVPVISTQVYFTGVQALPLISVLALASGSIVVMQSNVRLSLLGGPEIIGDLLVMIIVREISPLLTALVVIARSGTAVASELGNMKVNHEIEALELMGINPLSYIVFPRLVGGVLSVLALAFYFIIISLISGFLVSSLIHSIPFMFYLESLARAFFMEDVLLFLAKNTFSGAIIFVVCCYQGLLVRWGPEEVPQATTKAVMNSIIYVTVFNLSVTSLFYFNKFTRFGVI